MKKTTKTKSAGRLDREIAAVMGSPGSMLSDVAFRRRESSVVDLGPSIGTTRSGKAVFEHALSGDYGDFTKQDHLDAADLHRDFAGENRTNYKFRAHHKVADEHERRAALIVE